MTSLVDRVIAKKTNIKKFDDFKSGDSVNVSVKVTEGSKERIQVFKGVVIKVQGKGTARSFTVRKMSSGVGVERTFPFASPAIEDIQVISRGKVRRSRLFFLRNLRGRAARLESTLVHTGGDSKSKKKEEATTEAK